MLCTFTPQSSPVLQPFHWQELWSPFNGSCAQLALHLLSRSGHILCGVLGAGDCAVAYKQYCYPISMGISTRILGRNTASTYDVRSLNVS